MTQVIKFHSDTACLTICTNTRLLRAAESSTYVRFTQNLQIFQRNISNILDNRKKYDIINMKFEMHHNQCIIFLHKMKVVIDMRIIVIIVVVVVIIAILNKNGSSGINSEEEAALLFSYFEKIRNQYYGGARNCHITIGSPVVDIDGTPVLSGHLAAYVTEDDSNSGRAQAMEMETKIRDGKFENLFVIRKKFSRQAKQDILEKVGARIQQTYSNDFIVYDSDLPMLSVLTDLKDFVEMTQKAQH